MKIPPTGKYMNKLIIILLLFTSLLFSTELMIDSVYTMDEILISRQGINGADMILQDYEKAKGFENELIIITHHIGGGSESTIYQDEEICFYYTTGNYYYNSPGNKLKLVYRIRKEKPTYFFINYRYIEPVFKLDEGKGKYVIVTTFYPGTGHFTSLEMYELVDKWKGYVKKINVEFDDFKQFLKEDQSYYKGYDIDFDNNYSFKRNIYNKGDANCCGTGGRVEGNFKLVRKGTEKEPVIFFQFDNVQRYDEPLR